ncbi:hypothetical protein EBR57_04650 [bacterium]|nr:hypothetical protein [bacterium]
MNKFCLAFGIVLTGCGVAYAQTGNIPMYYSNGNIGIGNTAPYVQLQVGPGNTGTLPIDTTGGSFRPQIYNTQVTGVGGVGAMVNDGTNNRRAGLFVNQSNATWGLSAGYSSGAPSFVVLIDPYEVLRITPAGNVGIGTNAPNAKLDVSGNIQLSALPARLGVAVADTLTYDGDALANYGLSVYNDSTGFPTAGNMVALSGYRGIRFFAGGGHAMSVSGVGNVGIGTTTPKARLRVAGSAVFGRGNDGDGPSGLFVSSDASFTHYNWEISTQKVIDGGFEIARSIDPGASTFLKPYLVVSREGNLGLGAPYPSERLVVSGNATVTGTLRATQVIVDTESWADDVFDPGYRLRPLSEVKAFVERERHLPDVPSEESLRKTGIDVNKVQAMQMRKIEELTLYILQLEQRVRALESKESR